MAIRYKYGRNFNILDFIAQEGNGKDPDSPDAGGRGGNQNKGISIDSALEQVNKLNLNGNEDTSNGLPRQDQTTDVAQNFATRGVQESDGDAQNVETNGLESSIMQVKKEFR